MPATITARDLRKSYGDLRAVDGVTFEVAPGEFFGILGPNGAGKTTTLEIIEGLRQADAGEATVLGLPPWPGTRHCCRGSACSYRHPRSSSG
jgi:ABC-2 type transport system ATP-binding protein